MGPSNPAEASYGEKGESEKVGVRYAGEGAEKPEYIEGVSNKPKLNRTPQTGLYAAPGEFDGGAAMYK